MGGYYDHVVPPTAVKPDSVAPVLAAGDRPGSFNRYGLRVPAGVVSPYAHPGRAPDPSVLAGCLSTGPGTIPPMGYVTTGQVRRPGRATTGPASLVARADHQ